MDLAEFDARIKEIFADMKRINDGCIVVKCRCGATNCFYEGTLDHVFKRVNEKCRKCGGTDKALTLGFGPKYEL